MFVVRLIVLTTRTGHRKNYRDKLGPDDIDTSMYPEHVANIATIFNMLAFQITRPKGSITQRMISATTMVALVNTLCERISTYCDDTTQEAPQMCVVCGSVRYMISLKDKWMHLDYNENTDFKWFWDKWSEAILGGQTPLTSAMNRPTIGEFVTAFLILPMSLKRRDRIPAETILSRKEQCFQIAGGALRQMSVLVDEFTHFITANISSFVNSVVTTRNSRRGRQDHSAKCKGNQ